MKLKLKITKTLKRDLKKIAEKHDQERADYVQELIDTHLVNHESDWKELVEDYPALLERRQAALIQLKDELVEEEENIKRAALKAFYAENHMYREYASKNRKFENLIVPLSDEKYYAMCILSEKKNTSVERYAIELLTISSKNSL